MKWLVAASLAALIEAGVVTAVAAEPPVSPPTQTTVQQSNPRERIQRGRWVRNGRVWRHRQWECREIAGRRSCRWRYW